MTPEEFKDAVRGLKIGKMLPDAVYIHYALLKQIPSLAAFVAKVSSAVKIESASWNVLKLYRGEFKFSCLNYPQFDSDPYPALANSTVVDLERKTVRSISFDEEDDPPILHRKELLVSDSYPGYLEFLEVTKEAEAAGLYQDPRRIGTRQRWDRAIHDAGYELIDGRLFRRRSAQSAAALPRVAREKTAISRSGLSAPLQAIDRFGLLDGSLSVCDYGCGLGQDMAVLVALGIDVVGWDPYHRPEGDRFPSDLVNLGYVINVIEDKNERDLALKQAWSLAQKLLVVSAMVASDAHIERFEPYKDGVLTSKNTFQKYFSQASLKEYIEETLGQPAKAVGPGLFFIFRDEELEARVTFARENPFRVVRRNLLSAKRKPRVVEIYEQHQEACDRLWSKALELGRWPKRSESGGHADVYEVFGGERKAQNALLSIFDEADFSKSEIQRKESILLKQAMQFFERRQPFSSLPIDLQLDVRSFFGSYKELQAQARGLLASLADTDLLSEACEKGFDEAGRQGFLTEREFVFPAWLLGQAPILIQAYVACALRLASDVDKYDLIKIHIQTGKCSFFRYKDFSSSPIPALEERVKVSFFERKVSYFDYFPPHKPQPLYWKSSFLLKESPDYEKQLSFDRRLDELGIASENPLRGFSFSTIREILSGKGLTIKGYRFFKTR